MPRRRRESAEPPAATETLYSTAQVATFAGISRKLIWDWVKEGVIRPCSREEFESGLDRPARRKGWWNVREAWEVRLVASLRKQNVGLFATALALDVVRRGWEVLFPGPGKERQRYSLVIYWDEARGCQEQLILADKWVADLTARGQTVVIPLVEPDEEYCRAIEWDGTLRDALAGTVIVGKLGEIPKEEPNDE